VALRPARLLVLMLAAWPLQASAQVGGVPGVPGIAPPPACQQLLAARDEIEKRANAIHDAGRSQAAPEETCRLFKLFLASGRKMIEGLEANAAVCGVPSEVIDRVKAQHARASRAGQQVCEAAPLGRDWNPIPGWGPPPKVPIPSRSSMSADCHSAAASAVLSPDLRAVIGPRYDRPQGESASQRG
jgi:hypothetical protein